MARRRRTGRARQRLHRAAQRQFVEVRWTHGGGLNAMNLMLVNYEYPPLGGGAGNATAELARALVRAGHRVTVLTSGIDAQVGSERSGDLEIVRLRSRRHA